MMMNIGYGMMGGGMGFMGFLWYAIFVGLAVVVWLWVIKLWREVFGRKR